MKIGSGFVSFALVCVLSTNALAGFPSAPGEDTWANRPNDPGYHNAWQLFSHVPPNQKGELSSFEKGIGSGLHVDKAWQRHTGTPGTVIAVLDSGIYWNDDDLIDHFYLNPGELPLPQGSSVYDANGDGRFSVADYAKDPRVTDKNGNGVLDPEDLILTFSDGKDDDGNGFVDDIAGWDFHEHDNNAFDRTHFGHGTGEARDSAAILNNGKGDAGVCGNCTVMPLRVNDSFVVDASAFAAAVIYATDQKVSIVQEALGSVNHSPLTKRAVEYAYAHDVVVIGSAADECSFHHNYPANLDPVIYTNAIRYDHQNQADATTYLNFNNCSNFGARVDVAVPALHCSSEATGLMAGVAGLAASYAKALGKPMSAGELVSLIRGSATDINLGPADPDSHRYPTYAGWDSLTGYGRANADVMMKAIQEDRVPPELRIVSPEWFELFAVGQRPAVAVEVKASTRRAPTLSLTLSVFRGVETAGSAHKTVMTLKSTTAAYAGKLAEISLTELQSLPPNTLDLERDRNSFTLLLSAEDSRGNRSETRKTFFVFEDRFLRAGFPAKLKGSGESPGLFVDLKGDKKQEYVMGDGAGYLHAFTADGTELPGFPARTAGSRYAKEDQSSIIAPIAAGDLDQDGKNEAVSVSLEGDLSVIQSDGKMRAGFPVRLPFPDMSKAGPGQVIGQGVYASPVLADLTHKGRLQIIVVALDGLIHSYESDGKVTPGFPVPITRNGQLAKLLSSPAVYDLNDDGIDDLILGSNQVGEGNGYLYAVDGRGLLAPKPILAGFPAAIPILREVLLPTIGVGIPASPALADFDGDGKPEILIHPFVGKSFVLDRQGKIIKTLSMKVAEGHNTNDTFMVSGFGNPAIGDVLGNGKRSPVTIGVGKRFLTTIALGGKRNEHQHMVSAWDYASGAMLKTFPRQMDDMMLSPSPTLADLDNDGGEDVIVGSGGYYLHGFTQKGEASGFPHFTGGWMYGSASVGDMEGDGKLEVAVSTREGYVFIWNTDGKVSSKKGWNTFKANAQRTGYLP